MPPFNEESKTDFVLKLGTFREVEVSKLEHLFSENKFKMGKNNNVINALRIEQQCWESQSNIFGVPERKLPALSLSPSSSRAVLDLQFDWVSALAA
ncbi:unnamed protein product [Rodentolepis nana]|uniref:Uncharacterized protein n=1 Tax=Rodentolepis nana TaxID=102285 RepID=A0A0R3TT63_RODNA|nr:unnamed protein product [Rodentolepis nana]